MQCPQCRASKAYRREPKGATQTLLSWTVGLIPMRCDHCYHKFTTLYLLSLGERLDRPTPRPAKAHSAT